MLERAKVNFQNLIFFYLLVIICVQVGESDCKSEVGFPTLGRSRKNSSYNGVLTKISGKFLAMENISVRRNQKFSQKRSINQIAKTSINIKSGITHSKAKAGQKIGLVTNTYSSFFNL